MKRRCPRRMHKVKVAHYVAPYGGHARLSTSKKSGHAPRISRAPLRSQEARALGDLAARVRSRGEFAPQPNPDVPRLWPGPIASICDGLHRCAPAWNVVGGRDSALSSGQSRAAHRSAPLTFSRSPGPELAQHPSRGCEFSSALAAFNRGRDAQTQTCVPSVTGRMAGRVEPRTCAETGTFKNERVCTTSSCYCQPFNPDPTRQTMKAAPATQITV